MEEVVCSGKQIQRLAVRRNTGRPTSRTRRAFFFLIAQHLCVLFLRGLKTDLTFFFFYKKQQYTYVLFSCYRPRFFSSFFLGCRVFVITFFLTNPQKHTYIKRKERNVKHATLSGFPYLVVFSCCCIIIISFFFCVGLLQQILRLH